MSERRRIEPDVDVKGLRRLAGPPRSRRARAARVLAPLGDDLKPWLAATPILCFTGRRGCWAALCGWTAVGVASGLAHGISALVRRQRPGPEVLANRAVAGDQPSSSSFPSTHTSSAFGFATAASVRMPEAALVLAPLALLVAWTRTAGGRHYPSDVLAGAATGAVAAAVVMFGQRQLPRVRRQPALSRRATR
jgi:membrane-associated phospholipid phosphatase